MTQEWEGGEIERTAKEEADSRDFKTSRKEAQERDPIEVAARRSGLNGCLMMIVAGLFGFTPLFVDLRGVSMFLIVPAVIAVCAVAFIGNHKINKADEVLYGKRN